MARPVTLSVIIPTLNAASGLRRTCATLATADEVIVVDGGSSDGTPDIARSLGLRLLASDAGRGHQLMAGAAQARGEWLLFLHADTRLDPDWISEAADFMSDPANRRRAGAFRFALESSLPQARRLEAMVAWRTRVLALPYGDQGLLISRPFYDALGGYRPLPLMEDVDLIRRIGRRSIVALSARAVTSAERWHRDGWWRRSARNLACLLLYFAGLSPRLIQRLYG